uniref:Uncharacterized protein n=1 Tax=Anguilla anguilla TaxID=7936 RepID=A0A0E9VA26_ANGAN
MLTVSRLNRFVRSFESFPSFELCSFCASCGTPEEKNSHVAERSKCRKVLFGGGLDVSSALLLRPQDR